MMDVSIIVFHCNEYYGFLDKHNFMLYVYRFDNNNISVL